MAKFLAPESAPSVETPATDSNLKEQYTPKIRDLIGGHDPHHHHNHKNAENCSHTGNEHDFHGQVRAMQAHHKGMVSERAKGYLNKLVKLVKSKRGDE